jgi:hypothetical protein
MINVVAMNLNYTIPVKLFSIHLIIMTFILLIKEAKTTHTFFYQK